MNHPALIVLKLLLSGETVKIGDDDWCYYDGKIGVERLQQRYKNGKLVSEDQVVCRVEYPLDVFIKDCEKISVDDLFLRSTENALKRLKEEKDKERENSFKQQQEYHKQQQFQS